jgi:hypothetical protein
MDHYEIAQEMSKALGRPVTYEPISLDEFTERLHNRGFNEHTIQHLRAVAIDYRNGVFAGTNDIVRTISGTEPQSVQEYVTRNKKHFDDISSIGGGQVLTGADTQIFGAMLRPPR